MKMWYDASPIPDARHARALASDTMKEVNTFIKTHRRALEDEDAGYRQTANEERKRVQAARKRISDLCLHFPLDLQGKLMQVIETIDKTLRVHLPFDPPLEDDPDYLAAITNRPPNRGTSEIGIPTAGIDRAPVRLARSVTDGPTSKVELSLPPTIEVDGSADETKEIFYDARRVEEISRINPSLSSLSTPTIVAKERSSTPRESRSAHDSPHMSGKPASLAGTPLASSVNLIPPTSSSSNPVPSVKITAEGQTEALKKRYDEIEQEKEGIMEVIKRLSKELKCYDDEKEKIKSVAKNINGDLKEDDIVTISNLFGEENRGSTVSEDRGPVGH